MSGNVNEWCLDHWSEDYKKVPEDGSPLLTSKKTNDLEALQVVRGGSWFINFDFCLISSRDWNYANSSYGIIGFRVLRC